MADDQKPVLFGSVDYKALGLGLAVALSALGIYASPDHRHTDDESDKRQWVVISQQAQDIAANAKTLAVVSERLTQNVERCNDKFKQLEAELRDLRAERDRLRR